MKIIISPTKTMDCANCKIHSATKAHFEIKAQQIYRDLQTKDTSDLRHIYNCSDKIIQQNLDRLAQNTTIHSASSAIGSFTGLQFKHINANLMSCEQINYLQNNLLILSALYGVLRPLDGVVEYRLDVCDFYKINGENLSRFWLNTLSEYLSEETIINLASTEYSNLIHSNKMINIKFYTIEDGKLKTKSTFSKMARGSMVNFLATNKIKLQEDIKQFNSLEFNFNEELSTDNTLVFTKNQ